MLPLAHFAVHQDAAGALTLRLDANGQQWAGAARAALAALFGPVPLRVALLAAEDKVVQYTSDLGEALA
ncbi:hypothetical protein C9I28_20700 [Pseudoduganella armeniaca]|uniref:Uncharacterized protein n=1 Tax=Pseudoduganella armeniaca TaxID=2072590 RepID=A0A2R4CDR3_9BURK|nr:hypothetical protein C9I28_20700 [Pseudoduganella armeniaca]